MTRNERRTPLLYVKHTPNDSTAEYVFCAGSERATYFVQHSYGPTRPTGEEAGWLAGWLAHSKPTAVFFVYFDVSNVNSSNECYYM